MTKEEHVQYWLNRSQRDIETAKSMFRSKHFDWSLFVAHLAVEKILKALWVMNNESNSPPRIHNLLRLAEGAKYQLTDDEIQFLGEVNEFQTEARYDDFKYEFYKKCTPQFVEPYLKRMEEFQQCILNKLSSKQ
jgi:HEPN domain-containing protein